MAAAFQLRFMVFSFNVINRYGSRNEMHLQLKPKKAKVIKALLVIYIAAYDISPAFIANKTKCFSFKSGCVVRVENSKMHFQLKPKKANVKLYYSFT